MNIKYGELYEDTLCLISENRNPDIVGFRLPIFQVMGREDGQHCLQLFGRTNEEPQLKFVLNLHFKFINFTLGADNGAAKILDMLYISGALSTKRFDPTNENFLKYLCRRFQVEPADYVQNGEVELKYIPLGNNLVTFADFFSNKLELKVFHQEPYFEWYVNIDFPAKRVTFQEKDPEYRAIIVDSFR